jgi:hypothetical protein
MMGEGTLLGLAGSMVLLGALMPGCSSEVLEEPTGGRALADAQSADVALAVTDGISSDAEGDVVGEGGDASDALEESEVSVRGDASGATGTSDAPALRDGSAEPSTGDADRQAELDEGDSEQDSADDGLTPPADGGEETQDAEDGEADLDGQGDIGPIEDASVGQGDTDDNPPVESPVYEGTCCALNGSPGCDDPGCVAEICAQDAYCCEVTWDVTCALCAMGGSFDDSCAGSATACPCDVDAAGSCCESHPSALCDSAYCVAAVCQKDPFCCGTAWDSYCVACAQGGETYAGVSCESVPGSCDCEVPPSGPTHLELAEAWAPVWFHDTDDTSYASDYITAFDFDGDTVSHNNWENVFTPAADLSAVIYWSVIETLTHWYILYADFHPRDWTENCDPLLPFLEPCHENDMEGAMVMVKKDDSQWGAFVLLVTEAHNLLHVFRNDPAITAKATEHLEGVGVSFEATRHPKLYVESKGHGVCALGFDGPDHCQHPVGEGDNPFPGGDGIVYRFKGQAEVPSGGNDQDVGYALVSLYDTIWQQRDSVCDGGCTFDGTFDYEGTSLPKAFDGDTWGEDKANPPWAWDDPDDGPVYRGDFFFRPASAVNTWVDVPGALSMTYVDNAFLADL